jgi:hypothetical protein
MRGLQSIATRRVEICCRVRMRFIGGPVHQVHSSRDSVDSVLATDYASLDGGDTDMLHDDGHGS